MTTIALVLMAIAIVIQSVLIKDLYEEVEELKARRRDE